jgi:hypothetical protein
MYSKEPIRGEPMQLNEVIKKLKETYPLKNISPETPERALWIECGRQQLIELLEIWAEQEDETGAYRRY